MATGETLSFGALLRHYRSRAGLTQEMLAQRSRVGERTIRSIERGAQRTAHPKTVRLLADALGLSEQERALVASAAARGRGAGASALLPAGAPPTAGGVKSRLLREASLRAVGRGWT